MKRPLGITLGIMAHCIFIVYPIVESLRVGYLGIGFLAVFIIVAIIHVSGIVGLTLRYKWARRYSMGIFAAYAIFHFGVVSRTLKNADFEPAIWSGFIMLLTLWLLYSYYTEPNIAQYLSRTIKRKQAL